MRVSTDKVRVAVIDYFSAYVGEDVEQAIKGFGGAFSALKDFAAKFEVAVIPLCRLPCHGGSGEITRAIDALSVIPGVDSVLLVEGTARGTVVPKKTWAGLDAKAVAFRTSKKPGCFDSASVIEWENSIATKSAVRYEAYTAGSLSNREIANTSNPDVSHESSSPGAVPAQSDEIPATPPGPSPSPGMASANSTEGAAATRGTIHQRLRPGASANVGKPVLALTKPLARKPTVPVTPLHPQPAPGASRPFSSVPRMRRTKNSDGWRNLPSAANGPWAAGRTRQRNLRRNRVSSGNGRYSRRKGKD